MECPVCHEEVSRLRLSGQVWACFRCLKPKPRGHVYTGRKVWVGSEVYGNKLNSDELRADTEAAMIGGSGSGLKG